MKKNRLQIDDLVLVTGPAHYEKAKVKDISKGIITLDNNMKIDRDFNNLSKSIMKAEPYDDDKFNFLHASSVMEKKINAIQRNWKKLNQEEIISLNNKIDRILTRFNLKVL